MLVDWDKAGGYCLSLDDKDYKWSMRRGKSKWSGAGVDIKRGGGGGNSWSDWPEDLISIVCKSCSDNSNLNLHSSNRRQTKFIWVK